MHQICQFRLFDYFTSAVKDGVLKAFSRPDSPLRIVIATIAFGMGIDTSDIRYVVHWGPPQDIEQYVQATGGLAGMGAHHMQYCCMARDRSVM